MIEPPITSANHLNRFIQKNNWNYLLHWNIFVFLISLFCFFAKSQSNSSLTKKNENQYLLKWGDYYSSNGQEEKAIKLYSENLKNLTANQRRILSKFLQNKGDLNQAVQVLKPLLGIV